MAQDQDPHTIAAEKKVRAERKQTPLSLPPLPGRVEKKSKARATPGLDKRILAAINTGRNLSQPPAQPHSRVVVERAIGFAGGADTEVIGPPANAAAREASEAETLGFTPQQAQELIKLLEAEIDTRRQMQRALEAHWKAAEINSGE
jgi:hypothetical protein